VTAADVKFSFECVRDPKFKAAARMPYVENIASVEVVDPSTIKIQMKKLYYKNLEVLGTVANMPIVPQHVYGDPDKKFSGAPLFGSGPYVVESYNRGKNIVLARNPNWWGKDIPHFKGLAKFERISFRFVNDQNLALEMVKKGQIDYMWPITI